MSESLIDTSKDLAIENLTKMIAELKAQIQAPTPTPAVTPQAPTADEIVKNTFEAEKAKKDLENSLRKDVEDKYRVEQYLKEFNDPTLNEIVSNLDKGQYNANVKLGKINEYAINKLKEKYDTVPTIKASLSVIQDYETAKIMIRNLETTITTPKTDVKVESPLAKKFNNSKTAWHSSGK